MPFLKPLWQYATKCLKKDLVYNWAPQNNEGEKGRKLRDANQEEKKR